MDSGTASRFFYSAKADAQDRFDGKHPTVKPVNLRRWLSRLVTPPNGLVLDLFAGSGTTGAAAVTEGFRAILIEADPEYQADIWERLAWLFVSFKAAFQPLAECLAHSPGIVQGRKIALQTIRDDNGNYHRPTTDLPPTDHRSIKCYQRPN